MDLCFLYFIPFFVFYDTMIDKCQSNFRFPPVFPSFSLESSFLLKPLAVCDFDDGETCGWMHEEVPWTHRWVIERDRLCLKAKVSSSSSSKKISSWLQGLASAQSGDKTDVKVRFSSPPIPASLGMKCVALVYLIEFGREMTSKPPRVSGSLSLLQQHKGYFSAGIRNV